ncbi:unnamed protein product [Caenorhabditis bovis]|nr:unnamed protein product [Caenorhabditis bovis]
MSRSIHEGKISFVFGNTTVLISQADSKLLTRLLETLGKIRRGETVELDSLTVSSNDFKPSRIEVRETSEYLAKRKGFSPFLETLTIQPGCINQIDHQWQMCKKLKVINFSGNPILERAKSSDFGVFRNLEHVASICLADCDIGNSPIEKQTLFFNSLPPNISFIDLSGNNLKIVPNLYKYRHVNGLSIANNRIKVLPGRLFKCLELRTLDIGKNPISYLPNVFHFTTSLQKIDTSETFIERVHEKEEMRILSRFNLRFIHTDGVDTLKAIAANVIHKHSNLMRIAPHVLPRTLIQETLDFYDDLSWLSALGMTDDLSLLLQQRIEECERLKVEIFEAKFSNVEGVFKMRNRLDAELRFLRTIEDGVKPLERKYLDTTNVTHLSNIIHSIEKFEDVIGILHTFAIRNVSHYSDEHTLKHTVDIVANNGQKWVKIVSRSARGILMDWMTGCSRNVFNQAKDYIRMSHKFKYNFAPPKICVYFCAGVADKMAEKLKRKNIEVIGNLIEIDTITKVPDDFLEMLEEDSEIEYSSNESDDDDEESGVTLSGNMMDTKGKVVNLDVSAVFVLISNMTHGGGANHRFASPLLEMQAVQEREKPAKPALERIMKDKQLLICQTAYDAVVKIMSTVSGPTEMERWKELEKKLKIVPDRISDRASNLAMSDRIKERNLKIFGSGDYYQAVTLTANKHFVSSAYHQGVAFNAFIHESRALSEQKERHLDWVPPQGPRPTHARRYYEDY